MYVQKPFTHDKQDKCHHKVMFLFYYNQICSKYEVKTKRFMYRESSRYVIGLKLFSFSVLDRSQQRIAKLITLDIKSLNEC